MHVVDDEANPGDPGHLADNRMSLPLVHVMQAKRHESYIKLPVGKWYAGGIAYYKARLLTESRPGNTLPGDTEDRLADVDGSESDVATSRACPPAKRLRDVA